MKERDGGDGECHYVLVMMVMNVTLVESRGGGDVEWDCLSW